MIGQMRDLVDFETPDTTGDAYGNTTDGTYSALYSDVRARVRFERGREKLEAGRMEAATAGVITVRAAEVPALTHADRVLIDSVAYQIRDITNPDRRGRFKEISFEKAGT